MEVVTILLKTITELSLAIPKILLSLLPLYNALSDFKQNLIAAALGVSPVVIGIVVCIWKIARRIN